MWDVSLLAATQLVEKSMGFLLHRWLIFLAVAAGFLLATLAGAGTAVGIGSLSANPLLFAHVGAVAGFSAFAWICYKARRALYRNVRLPHLFLLAKLSANEGGVPGGRAQIEFARNGMSERAPDQNLIWEIRQTTAAVLARLPHSGEAADASPPVSWRARLMDQVQSWLCASNVDSIISAIIREASTNPWQSARTNILLHAKNLTRLSRNRVVLAVFQGLGWFLAYLLLQLAFRKIAAGLPLPTGIWPQVFAFIFAWNIKASFLEPISDAAMLQLSLQAPDANEARGLAARLAADSEPFRRIESRTSASDLMHGDQFLR